MIYRRISELWCFAYTNNRKSNLNDRRLNIRDYLYWNSSSLLVNSPKLIAHLAWSCLVVKSSPFTPYTKYRFICRKCNLFKSQNCKKWGKKVFFHVIDVVQCSIAFSRRRSNFFFIYFYKHRQNVNRTEAFDKWGKREPDRYILTMRTSYKQKGSDSKK